jgi:hypothetical protein
MKGKAPLRRTEDPMFSRPGEENAAMAGIPGNVLVGRDQELAALTQRLAGRHSLLLHGPAGVGKTALLRAVLPNHPEILYCPESSSKQTVFRALAAALAARDRTAASVLGGPDGIKAKSAVSLKGIVQDRLRCGKYWVVLDHLRMPSQAFAADIKDVAGWATTPILGVARSHHMEDVGFLKSLFIDRSEKLELRNFDDAQAERFARQVVEDSRLTATNMGEFLARVLQFSAGNPGAIIGMVNMAKLPKYRSGTQIMLSPLYIDYRLGSGVATTR